MIKLLISAAGSVVLLGLGLALMTAFDWDLGAVLSWAWGFGNGLVGTVVEFFLKNPPFQEAVRG